MTYKLSLLSLFILTHFSFAARWYETYDFGHLVSQVVSYENDSAILRGNAIVLGGKDKKFTAYYDTASMNLRYLTDGSIVFKGTPWDGAHGGNSIIEGNIFLSSKPSLSWAYKGSWIDP